MKLDRRTFLGTVGAGAVAMHLPGVVNAGMFAGATSGAAPGVVGVGMCDWNLGDMCDPDMIPRAREAHLEGIQVSVGTGPDNMPLRDPAVRTKYVEMGRRHDVTFHSIACGMLNSIPLATEPQSAVFVVEAIEAAAALGSSNVLLAFFSRGDLRRRDGENNLMDRGTGGFSSYELKEEDVSRVVAVLRQLAPRAEDAGIILGLENTITARQTLDIIEQVGSGMVQVYYDVGNSTGNGYDVPGELRMLGNSRICEVHLKDWNTSMLGSEGAMVDMEACAGALRDIGYDKWLVLETSGRRDRFIVDTRANVAFAKKTFQMA
jgi:sugar phosphate isomerase/epimerase